MAAAARDSANVAATGGGGGGKKDGRLTDGDDVAEKRAGDMLDRNKIRPRNRTTGQKASRHDKRYHVLSEHVLS